MFLSVCLEIVIKRVWVLNPTHPEMNSGWVSLDQRVPHIQGGLFQTNWIDVIIIFPIVPKVAECAKLPPPVMLWLEPLLSGRGHITMARGLWLYWAHNLWDYMHLLKEWHNHVVATEPTVSKDKLRLSGEGFPIFGAGCFELRELAIFSHSPLCRRRRMRWITPPGRAMIGATAIRQGAYYYA